MISKRYPQYVDMIKNAPITGRYVVQKTAVNSLNIIDKKFNAMFYNNIDPMMGVEKELKERKIKLPSIGVFMGFGLGYHFVAYHKSFSPIDLIVIFEKDLELINVAFTHVDYGNLFQDPRIQLCLGLEPVQYYPTLFRTLQMGNAKLHLQAINFIEIGAAIIANKDYYTNCVRTLKDGITGVMNLYGNDPKDSMIGIQNTFYNIDVIIENAGVKDLKNAFKGKPGVVVSTGPSLNKNIHLLEGLGDKAVIAAADASLAVMHKRGLKPHFVTSLERVIATAKLFDGLTEEDVKDVYFAACPVVMPETYKNFPGEKV
ncbi:MAG: DUF115 domain-containing protein, partial [Deferribacteraceae bacterium]|nr:DUF115 domain-containing protein [Deferribacteraceae bacterium]